MGFKLNLTQHEKERIEKSIIDFKTKHLTDDEKMVLMSKFETKELLNILAFETSIFIEDCKQYLKELYKEVENIKEKHKYKDNNNVPYLVNCHIKLYYDTIFIGLTEDINYDIDFWKRKLKEELYTEDEDKYNENHMMLIPWISSIGKKTMIYLYDILKTKNIHKVLLEKLQYEIDNTDYTDNRLQLMKKVCVREHMRG